MKNNYILPLDTQMNNINHPPDFFELKNGTEMTFLLSCRDGNFNKVSDIINKKQIDINTRAFNGDTGLILSIYNEHFDIANFLIDNGSDVNCYNKFRNTALIIACRKVKSEDLSLIEKLIKYKANKKWSNNFLETPKKIALQRNMPKLLELLK
jgi:ankyrin repeat protein